MERCGVATTPPRFLNADADLDLLLGQKKLESVKLDQVVANHSSFKRHRPKLFYKPQKTVGLQLLSKARCNNIVKVFFHFCCVWIIFTLLWIRWPIYYRKLFPLLVTRLGDKMEVEPVVVLVALVMPFLFAGIIFYWNRNAADSLVQRGQQHKLLRWLQAHPTIGKNIGFDAIDIIVVGGFLLLQLNLVIGKLLIDHESGKLAKAGYLNRIGRAFGMNGLYGLMLSIILVSRQSFLHKFFGLSSERAARYHVLTGQFGFVILFLHGSMYIVLWYMKGKVIKSLVPCFEQHCSPKQHYGPLRNLYGLFAMISLCIVVISSMKWMRRHYFQRFVTLHSFNALSVTFTMLHYYAASYWIIPSIILYSIYRTVSLFGRKKASIVSMTMMSNQVVQLELRRSIMVGSDFVPGQYVYIKVDTIGNEWHPFSISSSPLCNRHSFVLNVKVQGSFTSQLLRLVKKQQLHTIHVDGYYGSEIKLAPHMVFIAGGSGMTPFLSLLDHLKTLGNIHDQDEMLTDECELPRTLWVIWTCRDLELLEAYAKLLDAVNRCSRWKCKIWLHHTYTDENRCTSSDDDCQTEPDDMSEDSSPRAQRFYPVSLNRHAFSGHSYMLGLPLFVSTALGCLLLILCVFRLKEFSSKSFTRRLLLLGAGTLGALLGATFVLSFMQRRNARKSSQDSDGVMDIAMDEMEIASLDVMSPITPSTPRSMPSPAQSLLHCSFLIEKERPDLGLRLRIVHKEIREHYGMNAEVALLISGPADLQRDALLQARELVEPAFAIHEKSFLL